MIEELNPLVDMLVSLVAFLDSMPAYIRGLLAGLIAAIVLRFFEQRVCEDEIQFCQSYRKACLTALLAVPLIAALVPDSRMAVFVEVLPEPASWLSHLWLAIGIIWLVGFAFALWRLLRAYYGTYAELINAPLLAADEKVFTRLSHWQNRLGLRHDITLVEHRASAPLSVPFLRRIGFPTGALVGPENVADILLIQELCHHKRHTYGWLLFANLVACCYWPVTWVPALTRRLLGGAQTSIDSLAESCYGDRMGYARGLRAVEQRLMVPGRKHNPSDSQPAGAARLQRLKNYIQALAALYSPQTNPALDFDTLFASRDHRDQHILDEPYEKVFWFVGQAIILALLISGPTLKPLPPEIEDDGFLPFQFVWMENFHRNQERIEHELPPLEPLKTPE